MSKFVKDPAEAKLVTFAFGGDIAAGQNITQATVSAAIIGTTTAIEVVPSAATIDSDRREVVALISGGGDGGDYELRCLCTDSSNQVHLVAALLQVRRAVVRTL